MGGIGAEDGGIDHRLGRPLKSYDDVERLRFPCITVDHDATARVLELGQETLGDLLTVRLKTIWWWTMGMTWTLAKLRGLEHIMYDIVEPATTRESCTG